MAKRMASAWAIALGLMGAAQASGMATTNDANTPPDPQRLINAAFIAETREWLANPIVGMMVEAQSERHASLTQADIDALDQQWRAEREVDNQPLISATLSTPLSSYLTRIQASALGLYTEMFIVDAKGLNVGQSAITGDYWQGDEAKYENTFLVGVDAVFIDEAEWDEDWQIWRAQLNLSIPNEDGTQAIGAATIEVNLTELARRQRAQS
ncbi:MAG: hypothetical protein RIC24_07865 [Hyphomicrobiales bacterium]|jgi:hypothetical protein